MQTAPHRFGTFQAGAFLVEFALLVTVFFTFIFGVIELARAMYLINTLQESTRRAASAAAVTDFRHEAVMDKVRQRAIFRDSPGRLLLGTPVTDKHIRIDYMSLTDDGSGRLSLQPVSTMPPCPGRNRLTCLADPNNSRCIRFVRARVCDPDSGSACRPVRYQTLVPLINLPIDLPKATTIVTAETLGFMPGMTPCP